MPDKREIILDEDELLNAVETGDIMKLKLLQKYLYKVYSKNTYYPLSRDSWNNDNPTLGYCSIISLLVNDYFGGEIYKIKVDGISQYINLIDNNVVNFTSNQFKKEIDNNR